MHYNSQNPVEDPTDDDQSFGIGVRDIMRTVINEQKVGESDLQGTTANHTRSLDIDPNSVSSLVKIIGQENGSLATEIIEAFLTLNPASINLQFLLGTAFLQQTKNVEAINVYEKIISQSKNALLSGIDKDIIYNTHNNLGLTYYKMGWLEEAKKTLETAVGLGSGKADAYNSLGPVLMEMADISGAEKSYLRAVKLDPNEASYYWNLHSTSATLSTAKHILGICIKKDPYHESAILTLAGLEALTENNLHFNSFKESEWSDHPLIQSFDWVIKLPILPEIHFNRWTLYDSMARRVDKTRPFYEFGVWMGASFKYLSKQFSKGYGFDTFEGLPENWGDISKGSYSSYGKIPEVMNGNFIVGEFDKSLPEFFSIQRPLASIINYDADLYSSTLTALNNSQSVIDEETILIFDEFLVNPNWQNDEHAALVEFCQNEDFNYEVLAVSFFTKQMACKLIKK